ncbi:GNAT family N-acetyltransferase [candidate division WOR-3 bacterium]|uniref:GNAT family N-acetyltransferase n=1 Tax=candidate division WOR-3 bacterium TaxID=2052148 RepID=A0A9D5K7H9_UNCW3|nr:GNAT family N-acetyltransferase [candidate division WOR-3 bacterium]MBD3363751.1 GNAT family N-acetyltransferase [candidate division WOR-3 bacterium]
MQEKYTIVSSEKELKEHYTKSEIIEFLHKNLEQFRDPPDEIEKAIDYAFSNAEGKGGFIVLQEMNDELVGVVVINQTGMNGYIPDNILVYIATDSGKAPLGAGAKVMQHAMDTAEGDIALHVEYHNSAKKMYEKLGFKSKYAEMRYVKNTDDKK